MHFRDNVRERERGGWRIRAGQGEKREKLIEGKWDGAMAVAENRVDCDRTAGRVL